MKKSKQSAPPRCSVSHLSISFHTKYGTAHAVRDISFDLYAGEILALVGESGSGKSVTAQALLALLPRNATVRAGAIAYDGVALDSYSAQKLRQLCGGEVGLVFQESSRSFDPLYPIGKTLLETIAAHAPTTSTARQQQKALRLLDEIGIQDPLQRMKNYPHQFSGGQLQRINLALALAADPKILIADEPTTALDITTQKEIITLLQNIITHRNIAVLFISHDIALVSQIANRIAVMYSGFIMEIGETATVIKNPHHPYTHALLQSTINLGTHYSAHAIPSIRGTPPSAFESQQGCPFFARCPQAFAACTEKMPPIIKEESAHRCLLRGKKH